MSRGPLEVLREVASFMAQAYPSFSTADEMREAIAQVEALALSVQNAVAAYYDSDDAPNWKAIVNDLRVTVTPFTPGQDSEGGGNG